MAAGPFEIRLLTSKVTGPQPERDPMLSGHIRVTINGVVVADDDEFGVERSALGLLRSIERDHGAEARLGFPTLLVHDCGFPWYACSNFGADWTVRHEGDDVVIGDPHFFDSYPLVRDRTFPNAACRMTLDEYRAPILRFAVAVRDAYFTDGDKVIDDPQERQWYDEFWREYREHLDPNGAS